MTVRSYQEQRPISSDRVFYKKKQNNKDEYLLDADLQILFDRARSNRAQLQPVHCVDLHSPFSDYRMIVGRNVRKCMEIKLEFLDYEEFISKTPAAFHTTHIGVGMGKVLECSTNLAG